MLTTMGSIYVMGLIYHQQCSERSRKGLEETLGMWNHLETGVKKSYLLTQEITLLDWKKEFMVDSSKD